jgi:hypothetical protein
MPIIAGKRTEAEKAEGRKCHGHVDFLTQDKIPEKFAIRIDKRCYDVRSLKQYFETSDSFKDPLQQNVFFTEVQLKKINKKLTKVGIENVKIVEKVDLKEEDKDYILHVYRHFDDCYDLGIYKGLQANGYTLDGLLDFENYRIIASRFSITVFTRPEKFQGIVQSFKSFMNDFAPGWQPYVTDNYVGYEC